MSTLSISHGDYVIVQEGQVDLPKIIALDETTLSDTGSLTQTESVNVSVADDVLAQDHSERKFSIPLVVADAVAVREGQSDGTTPVEVENVSVNESVTLVMSLLRFTIEDSVTVADVATMEPLSLTDLSLDIAETVVLQEGFPVHVRIYVEVSDDVLALDGSREVNVSDDLTLAESVTLAPTPLHMTVSETLIVTDTETVSGPVLNVEPPLLFEELLVDEAVTLLLVELRLEVNDAVTMVESVSLTLTSIDLSITATEDVTLVEAVEGSQQPIQIDEFTEIVTVDDPSLLANILNLDEGEEVSVSDIPTLEMNLLRFDVADAVTIIERYHVSPGGRRRRRRWLTQGVG